MLSYEELKPILVSTALEYAKKSNFRYEINELVNEVWSRGKIQELPDIKMAWQVANWQMIGYMKSQQRHNILNESSNIEDIGIDNLAKFDDSLRGMEVIEIVGCILKRFCRNIMQRKVLYLTLKGLNQRQIAKRMRCTHQNISMILMKVRQNMLRNTDFMAEYFGKVA